MKATSTCTLLILACTISGMAQQLAGTYWETGHSGNVQGITHFSSDSVIQLVDSLPDLVVSHYTEIGNNFYITDKPGVTPCDSSIGHYTFEIRNDSLFFTRVTENCNERRVILTLLFYKLYPFLLNENDLEKGLKIFPNPANEEVNIEINSEFLNRKLYLTDALGQLILTQPMDKKIITIDLSELPRGMYFIRVEGLGETGLKLNHL
jgi:hypothetical protein